MFTVNAIITNILIFSLEENVVFGVRWGFPFIWVIMFSIGTIFFVKASLREERMMWRINLGLAT